MQASGKAGDPGENEPPGEASSWEGQDRRRADRRQRPTSPWKSLFGPLRRADGRRHEDAESYVDRYSTQDVALLMAIFLLNVADAFFTMMWLSRGGKEANPVMDFFLDIGPAAFLAQKCLVVGFWLVLLLVHKNFRFARIGLYATLVVYSLLLIVHFGILAFGVEPPRSEEVAQSEWIQQRMAEAGYERARTAPVLSPSASIETDLESWLADREAAALSHRVVPPASE